MKTTQQTSVIFRALLLLSLLLAALPLLAADKEELGRELRLAAAIDDVETMEKLLDQGRTPTRPTSTARRP